MRARFKLGFLLLFPVFTAIILTPLAVTAQEKKITGKITDESGTALNGASVVVKGTNIGTNADETGSYTITVPNSNAVLVVSFAGYSSKEIPSNAATTVRLAPDVKKQAMDEVVVI